MVSLATNLIGVTTSLIGPATGAAALTINFCDQGQPNPKMRAAAACTAIFYACWVTGGGGYGEPMQAIARVFRDLQYIGPIYLAYTLVRRPYEITPVPTAPMMLPEDEFSVPTPVSMYSVPAPVKE